MERKYAIAQINIPIEIFPNGEWTNHNDRITIQITRTLELPPISNVENQKIIETIEKILEGSQECEEEKIHPKISFDDIETQMPFIRENIQEPESTESLEIVEPNIEEPKDTAHMSSDSVQHMHENYKAFLNRKRRQPSKNTTFKRITHPIKNNKTRTNRWTVLKKDTMDAEY